MVTMAQAQLSVMCELLTQLLTSSVSWENLINVFKPFSFLICKICFLSVFKGNTTYYILRSNLMLNSKKKQTIQLKMMRGPEQETNK